MILGNDSKDTGKDNNENIEIQEHMGMTTKTVVKIGKDKKDTGNYVKGDNIGTRD